MPPGGIEPQTFRLRGECSLPDEQNKKYMFVGLLI